MNKSIFTYTEGHTTITGTLDYIGEKMGLTYIGLKERTYYSGAKLERANNYEMLLDDEVVTEAKTLDEMVDKSGFCKTQISYMLQFGCKDAEGYSFRRIK